jgi:hypothetical protein
MLVQFVQQTTSSGGMGMNRFLGLGVGIVCAALLTGFAQAAQETKKSDEVVTVTGCLEKGDEANTFKLSHTAETAGVAAKAAEAMKPDYELIGAPASLKLTEHVGHKVTITGAKVDAKEAAKIEGKESTAGEKMERHLKVTDIKHVAATCP